MMPGVASIADALIAGSMKGVNAPYPAGSALFRHQDQERHTIERVKCLTRQRMPLQSLDLEGQGAWLRVEDTEQWTPVALQHIDVRQIVEALASAFVDQPRGTLRRLDHITEGGKRRGGQKLGLDGHGLHRSSPALRLP